MSLFLNLEENGLRIEQYTTNDDNSQKIRKTSFGIRNEDPKNLPKINHVFIMYFKGGAKGVLRGLRGLTFLSGDAI